MGFRLSSIVLAIAVLTNAAAHAQAEFPTRTVRIIVPYAAGGVVDIAARFLRDMLAERWKQSIVVENRPGAATITGTNAVATSEPDGHTLGIVATPFLVNPSLQPNLPYNSLVDLTGVSMVVAQSVALVANPSVKANTLAELVSEAKVRPEPFTYGSSGTGGIAHLVGELFARTAGIKLSHIPYGGSAKATVDVLTGHIQLMCDPGFSSRQFVEEGKLKVLAISSKQRLAILPNVPTFNETFPGFDATSVQALIAPAAVPKAVLEKISADVQAVVRSQAFADKVGRLDLEPIASTPEEFNAYARREMQKWAEVIKAANIKGK